MCGELTNSYPADSCRAREMRLVPTRSEEILWQAIRSGALGVRFRRQVILGPVIVDFFAPSAALVVEVDGGQHADQIAYDERRTAHLERSGLRVLRFWNSAVLTNSDGVCLAILEACGGDHPEMGPG